MSQKKSEDITFQVTVGSLTVLSQLPEQDTRVTVCVNHVSKVTCSGDLSEDGLTVSWNHPFLFTASPFSTIGMTVCILPEQLGLEWEKKPLGDQIVTDVASVLSSKTWQCDVPGLSGDLSMTCWSCNTLDIPNGHDCLPALCQYQRSLYHFVGESRNMACAFTYVEASLAILDLCPLGHEHHLNSLRSLGTAYSFCYKQGGNVSDLNRSIEINQRGLDLCPLGHPNHVDALGDLAIVLGLHYDIQKNNKDLSRLIAMQEKWLELSPPGHSDHTRALGELALSLWRQYNIKKDIKDLNRAITMEEKKLDLCPEGHSSHARALSNLASSLSARFRKLGQMADLDKTIELQEKYLTFRPQGHRSHGIALRNLAFSFWDRFDRLKSQSDLTMANNLFQKALKTCLVQHPRYAFIVAQLAKTTLLLSNSSKESHSLDHPLPSSNKAFETYRLLKESGAVVSLELWNATQDWINNAEKYNHPSALEAYQTSLNTLDHFILFNSTLDSRHETMQARVAHLSNDAFSCAIRHGNFQIAVELLEQGRGILWSQLARFDNDMVANLASQGNREHSLGRKFEQLSEDLRKHAQQSGGEDIGPYWRAQEEWQSVVNEIRRLNGFSGFLLPPCFEDLRHAAEGGPVIIVNASKYTCDALIILNTGRPVHIPLPCSFSDVEQLCSQLSELTRDSHAYGEHRESYVKEMLRDLWSSVVEPIASTLQDDVQLPPGSRIWWCPTSKFTLLPFHAAGPYRKGKKSLMDIYVSSYAPSLSALIRTREHVRSQRETRRASGMASVISFAAVGQARPSADVKLSELVEVEHEIRRIHNETNMPPNVTFETVTGSEATIDGAIQAFRDHRWVHIACHGAQHANKPFESWFAMRDGTLTLMRIIQERYTNSEFAFLSACHTAVGDASTPDEVLHLAAGMQFAGFNGVIGTLWRVDDAVAHQVVTRFYKEMFKQPDVGFEHAAAALNAAALETADEVSLEKRIVFVHIGI